VTYRGAETVKANGFIVQMPLETIQINIMGRKKKVNDLRSAILMLMWIFR
jgi:hypothetical protein